MFKMKSFIFNKSNVSVREIKSISALLKVKTTNKIRNISHDFSDVLIVSVKICIFYEMYAITGLATRMSKLIADTRE